MDTHTEMNSDITYNFDLFSSDFELIKHVNVMENEENIPSEITDLLDAIDKEVPVKKDTEHEDSVDLDQTKRFEIVTSERIQELQGFNEADATHSQTEWAVKVFRGNYKKFIEFY